MAYLAQKAIYDTNMPYLSPDCPYNVVEQMASYYIKPFANAQDYHAFFFGLCLSLMTSHPAKTLDALLTDSSTCVNLSAKWSNVLEEYYLNTTVQDLNGVVMPITQSIDGIKEQALIALDKQFPTIDHYELRQWYHNAIEEMCM